MQTNIAQAAALVIHGNAFLKGADVASFWPEGSVFTFCERVAFVTLNGQPATPVANAYAAHPLAWFARLRSDGVLGLRLHHLPHGSVNDDRMSAGFAGGGGRWLLKAVKPAGWDGWEARWEPGNAGHSEQKSWRVTYGRTSADQAHVDQPPWDVVHLRNELKEALSAIAGFADGQGMDTFAGSFRLALELLDSPNPLAAVFHADLAPAGVIPLSAEQFLGVAQAAWVFGGMGSWNDVGFSGPDQDDYEELSNRLFTLLKQAVVEAANASCAPDSPRARPWWRFWSA